MTTRRDLIEGLRAAAITVDSGNTVRRYLDGIVFVLTEPAALTERRTYTVVATVNVGQDLDAYADDVAAAIAGIDGMVALSQTADYAAVPVPGRDMPNGDLMRIVVASDQLWH